MLEDLAAMEKYMSESYDGRTFVELLQNADDAESNRVKVFLIDDTLVVANDGRPFNKEDVMAICRSGASNKRRGENIGYRGVGFKSATTISTEIVIYSASVYFTFSKSVCAKALGLKEDQVPTVRIPFLYDQNKLGSKITKAIEKYKKDGFSTFFIFKQANAKKFFQELDGFNAGWLIFLKHISEVNIESQLFKKSCALKRKKLSDTEILLKVNGGNNQWYIVSDNNVSIAFKYDIVEGILPCGIEEAVFHSGAAGARHLHQRRPRLSGDVQKVLPAHPLGGREHGARRVPDEHRLVLQCARARPGLPRTRPRGRGDHRLSQQRPQPTL